MLKNLYIAAIEAGNGKSLVLLGLMELLSQRVERLGFFRPVIHAGDAHDNDIELVRSRYDIQASYEAQYALTHEEAQQLLAAGRTDELLKRVVAAYKALEAHCDFVVCEGVDATEIDSAFVDDFDAQVANLLSAPIALVSSGEGKSLEELISAVRTEREAFLNYGCAIAATFINRIAPELRDELGDRLQSAWQMDDPVFLLPEEPRITKPTVAEVMHRLGGVLVMGDDSRLNRDVLSYKVAAMQLPNFLSHVQEGALVITPGDRADIVLGCLTTMFAEDYPKIAGIALTGGLELAPSVQTLLESFRRSPLPIFAVATDTYETATRASQVRPQLNAANERKIAIALGLFESSVDLSRLKARIEVARSTRMTPLMFEYELIQQAKVVRQRVVLPEGADERILRATEILLQRNVVDVTLLGNRGQIQEAIATLGLQLDGVTVIDPLESDWQEDFAQTYYELRQHKGITLEFAHDMMRDVSYFGTMMVYKGLADGMVSGALHTTAHTIRPALEFIRTQPGCSIVSSVFLMCLEDRVLVYGDCAVNPNPNPQQLADIAISSAETAALFGIEPLVAMLSYSTGDSGKGEDVDKVREAVRIAQTQRPDLQIEGPIQYDAAVDASVAKTKLPDSKVAGRATVFIFPDLNTGNNTYKAVQRSANAVAIGPVLQGLRKPVNDLSRGCTVPDIVNTVAITAIQAQRVQATPSSPDPVSEVIGAGA
ncbi:MAG: phosphate acetyltransferase [Cyanobacteria bacterium J069]|nr:MAG: phosphate acetyltransferase [Cyanobacteria bacterium J069]